MVLQNAMIPEASADDSRRIKELIKFMRAKGWIPADGMRACANAISSLLVNQGLKAAEWDMFMSTKGERVRLKVSAKAEKFEVADPPAVDRGKTIAETGIPGHPDL